MDETKRNCNWNATKESLDQIDSLLNEIGLAPTKESQDLEFQAWLQNCQHSLDPSELTPNQSLDFPTARKYLDANATKAVIQESQYFARFAEGHKFSHELDSASSSLAQWIYNSGVKQRLPPSSSDPSSASASHSEVKTTTGSEMGLLRWTGSLSSEDFVEPEAAQGRGKHQMKSVGLASKNLVSERKRRKKLNDGLYSLRSLVPKISKMDKASIIGDSIVYVQELQQQIQTIEKEIAEIEEKVSSANCVAEEDSGGSGGSGSTESKEHAAGRGTSLEQVVEVVKPVIELNNTVMAASSSLVDPQDPSPGHSPTVEIQILNMEVAKLEEQTYQLKTTCQKGLGILVQLTRALESLDVDILTAHHIAFQDNMHDTFIVETRDCSTKKAEYVRKALMDAVAQHGLTVLASKLLD